MDIAVDSLLWRCRQNYVDERIKNWYISSYLYTRQLKVNIILYSPFCTSTITNDIIVLES